MSIEIEDLGTSAWTSFMLGRSKQAVKLAGRAAAKGVPKTTVPVAPTAPTRAAPAPRAAPTGLAAVPTWAWIGGGVVVGLGAVYYLVRRRRST